MTVLTNKILSYNPEQYIKFNNAYAINPGNLGTGGSANWGLTNEAPVLNATGGPDGLGCWQWNIGGNNDTSTTRFRAFGASHVVNQTELTDGDVSGGFWIKFTKTFDSSVPSSVSNINICQIVSKGLTGTINFQGGTQSNPDRGKISQSFGSGSLVLSTNRLDDTNWHYIAFRFKETSTNIWTSEFYLDGQLINSASNRSFTSTTSSTTDLGNTSVNAVAEDYGKMEISNFYYAPYATIGPTEILSIWNWNASGTDVTINETPATASALSVLPLISGDANNAEFSATASALQTEPTIIVQTGDHTEVTTSIPVSAEFAPAIVSTQSFVEVMIAPATATADIGDNVIVSNSTSVDFSTQEATASAVLVKPFLAESPMFASAQSGNHTIYVDPNYQNLITSIGPYLYIHDGSSTPQNKGYQSGTFTVSSALLKDQTAPTPIYLSGEGKSWRSTNTTGQDSSIRFNAPSNETSFDAILATGEWSVESWISTPDFTTNYRLLDDPSLIVLLLNGFYPGSPNRDGISVTIKNGPTTTENQSVNLNADGLVSRNTVYHTVITSTMTSSTTQLVRVWLNTSLLFSRTFTKSAWSPSKSTFFVINSDGSELYHDEIALYNRPLTTTEIINHYNFMNSLSPDAFITTEEAIASAEFIDGNIVIVGNAFPEIKEATASALIVQPTVIAGVSAIRNVAAFIGSATLQLPQVSYGITHLAAPNIAYAESVTGYYLNSVYYDYVQANITPYRYVTFDANNVYADYGTDNDYAVQPTVVGGTIVNPDEGISGKSAKTAGTSYITDGVILKESEYSDDWGTLGNRYHSAFWIQKTPEDNSTGLRIIWNLNGHYDNQHIILYQYQGKLTLSFSDGSSTYINQTTTNSINLFDGQRHFIVIYTDHQGVNDSTYLYVDSTLVMTVALGSYRVETINGISVVGPNDEANNHPRMSVGCLITPFAATSLPVIPTNTRIIADEIYFAKTAITPTMVNNLFNVMPDKDNVDYLAEPASASALSIEPSISTSVNFNSFAATASALINETTIIADRNIIVNANVALASAEMLGAQRLDNVIITADIMVASAIFNSAGATITRSGGPMLANVTLIDTPGVIYPIPAGTGGILINGLRTWMVLSPWAAWLRSSSTDKILPMREVK
jgi:hypothetical protein